MFARWRRGLGRLILLLATLDLLFQSAGCATTSHHGRPRALAFVGGGLALGGSTVWLVGENREQAGKLPAIGLATVAVGVATMIASGIWMAAEVTCQTDPDCAEYEECREIPAPPGGVPYKQCVPR
jgi:hypothetical protein